MCHGIADTIFQLTFVWQKMTIRNQPALYNVYYAESINQYPLFVKYNFL